MISEGWIWTGPAAIQRAAPLAEVPTPGNQDHQQHREGDGQEAWRELADRGQAMAGEDPQPDDPDQPEHQGALQVIGAVAGVAEQR